MSQETGTVDSDKPCRTRQPGRHTLTDIGQIVHVVLNYIQTTIIWVLIDWCLADNCQTKFIQITTLDPKIQLQNGIEVDFT